MAEQQQRTTVLMLNDWDDVGQIVIFSQTDVWFTCSKKDYKKRMRKVTSEVAELNCSLLLSRDSQLYNQDKKVIGIYLGGTRYHQWVLAYNGCIYAVRSRGDLISVRIVPDGVIPNKIRNLSFTYRTSNKPEHLELIPQLENDLATVNYRISAYEEGLRRLKRDRKVFERQLNEQRSQKKADRADDGRYSSESDYESESESDVEQPAKRGRALMY